jgi:glycosyltransferase involved in cell wall biosynthesis
MKVYVYPADEFGCGFYRLIWPAKALRDAGHDITIIPPGMRGTHITATVNNETNELVKVHYPDDADVIVIQRPTHKYLKDMIPLIQAKGTAVVVDVDDHLAYIHPENPAFTHMHPRGNADHSWKNCEIACARAAAVVTSTPSLFDFYAPHGRGAVLRNCVPGTYLLLDETKEYSGFGWAGSVQSHPDDLQVVGDAARKLVREGFKYYALGPGWKVKDVLGLDESPEAFGTIAIDEYPLEVSRLRVGLAPLALTKFNTAKSWLKPLEYAAVGTPCVMAPTSEYTRLHKEGVGLIARTPKEWYRQTKKLLTDESLYQELRAQGRAVASRHTYDINAWRWMEVWEAAVTHLRSGTIKWHQQHS